MPDAPAESWTTRKLLTWTTQHLERHGIENARLATEMLLGHVLGVERLKLYLDPDRPATTEERERFRGLIERATRHEPVDFLVGHAPFYGMEVSVDRRVLIPRPSTETLVDVVVEHCRALEGSAPLIADIGTGSGAVALALARSLPEARVIATDLLPEPLELARANAVSLGLEERIEFRQGSLLEPLSGERFSVIASNPPYIPSADIAGLDRNVRDHEPHSALDGGAEGLELLVALLEGAGGCLEPGGLLALEYNGGAQTVALLERIDQSEAWEGPRILKDHEGLERVVCCTRVG